MKNLLADVASDEASKWYENDYEVFHMHKSNTRVKKTEADKLREANSGLIEFD